MASLDTTTAPAAQTGTASKRARGQTAMVRPTPARLPPPLACSPRGNGGTLFVGLLREGQGDGCRGSMVWEREEAGGVGRASMRCRNPPSPALLSSACGEITHSLSRARGAIDGMRGCCLESVVRTK